MKLKDTYADKKIVDKPKWKEPITRAICQKCSAPCCVHMHPCLDREQAERHLSRFKGKYTYDDFGHPLLKQQADGSCVFFNRKKKTCSIYKNRPASCQAFFCGKGTRNNGLWKKLLHREKETAAQHKREDAQ